MYSYRAFALTHYVKTWERGLTQMIESWYRVSSELWTILTLDHFLLSFESSDNRFLSSSRRLLNSRKFEFCQNVVFLPSLSYSSYLRLNSWPGRSSPYLAFLESQGVRGQPELLLEHDWSHSDFRLQVHSWRNFHRRFRERMKLRVSSNHENRNRVARVSEGHHCKCIARIHTQNHFTLQWSSISTKSSTLI